MIDGQKTRYPYIILSQSAVFLPRKQSKVILRTALCEEMNLMHVIWLLLSLVEQEQFWMK